MEEKVVLQIKLLDKLIFRKLIGDNVCSAKDELRVPTPTQMHIISYMVRNEDKVIRQKDLEEILNLRRATVSGVLQTMEKNELITRVVDESDTRTRRLILSKKARNIFKKCKKEIDELESKLRKDISQEELDTFFSVIVKMRENLGCIDATEFTDEN